MLLSEHVYCVTVTFKMSKWSNKSASNFALSLNIPPHKLFGWFKRLLLWATGDWQLHQDNMPSHVSWLVQRFFGKTSNHPGDSAPLHPRFGTLQLWAFPKTKITFEREEISDHQLDSGQLMVTGRTVWGPKMPTLYGTEVSLSHVQCFLPLLSSINISIFLITWLDTFWIDLVYNSYTKNEKEQDLGDQKSMIGLLIINQVNRVVSYLKSKR